MSNNYSKWAPPGTKRRRKGWRKRRRERRARLAQDAASHQHGADQRIPVFLPAELDAGQR